MLNPGQQNRMGSRFTVVYPDFPSLTRSPKYINLHQEAGHHDIMELTYSFVPPLFAKALSTGVPVRVSYSNDKVKADFVGYVSHVSYPTVQTVERKTTVVCVGASYPLKERGSKIWVNKTASEIVVDIAKTVKLKPVVTPSKVRFNQVSLSGHSYWEKLQELALRTGYVAQVLGTELHFHPIDKMMKQFMSSIPLMLFLNNYTYPYNNDIAPTLDFFKPKLGDYVESEKFNRTNKVSSGVDPITGKVYTHHASPHTIGTNVRSNVKRPIFTEIETGTVSESQTLAREWAEAKAQKARFTLPADGAGQGDPRISPYRTIEVRGTGDSSDGFWLVTKANHFMHIDGRYQVEFSCATDGVGENSQEILRSTTISGAVISDVSLPGIGGVSARTSGTSRVPMRELLYDTSADPSMAISSTTTGIGVSSPSSPIKLSSVTTMLKESENGFTLAPRQWVGKPWPNGQSCCPSA